MKKKSQKKQEKHGFVKKGFTLIEILVVSTIIIIVSAIGLVSYSGAQVSARDAQRKQDLDNVRTTLLLYRTENGYYPVAGIGTDSRIAFSLPRQIIAQISSVFRAQKVQADEFVGDESGDSKTGGEDQSDESGESEDILDLEAAPTPTPTPTPTASPGGDTQQAAAIAYQELSNLLVEEGYLDEALPLDPINDATYYYGYNSDGSGFELTTRLEKDGSVVTLTD